MGIIQSVYHIASTFSRNSTIKAIIEQKNAKEQRSEEANDGKQCHTDVVRDADQGKSSIGNTGNLCPEIGQKIGKGHGLVVKKQGVCGKIPDCGRQKQKSEGSENGKCV